MNQSSSLNNIKKQNQIKSQKQDKNQKIGQKSQKNLGTVQLPKIIKTKKTPLQQLEELKSPNLLQLSKLLQRSQLKSKNKSKSKSKNVFINAQGSLQYQCQQSSINNKNIDQQVNDLQKSIIYRKSSNSQHLPWGSNRQKRQFQIKKNNLPGPGTYQIISLNNSNHSNSNYYKSLQKKLERKNIKKLKKQIIQQLKQKQKQNNQIQKQKQNDYFNFLQKIKGSVTIIGPGSYEISSSMIKKNFNKNKNGKRKKYSQFQYLSKNPNNSKSKNDSNIFQRQNINKLNIQPEVYHFVLSSSINNNSNNNNKQNYDVNKQNNYNGLLLSSSMIQKSKSKRQLLNTQYGNENEYGQNENLSKQKVKSDIKKQKNKIKNKNKSLNNSILNLLQSQNLHPYLNQQNQNQKTKRTKKYQPTTYFLPGIYHKKNYSNSSLQKFNSYQKLSRNQCSSIIMNQIDYLQIKYSVPLKVPQYSFLSNTQVLQNQLKKMKRQRSQNRQISKILSKPYLKESNISQIDGYIKKEMINI